METLKPLSVEAAPAASRAAMHRIQNRLGFVPNIMVTFPLSPASWFLSADSARRKPVKDFMQAGYTEAALTEIVVGVALKVMSDYLDHLNPITIDSAFRGEE